jgi:hypothetical protein
MSSYMDDEWHEEDEYDEDEDCGDPSVWDDDWFEVYEESEPRPLTVLERIDQWFSHTRIGRAWHVLVDRPVDVDDIPF